MESISKQNEMRFISTCLNLSKTFQYIQTQLLTFFPLANREKKFSHISHVERVYIGNVQGSSERTMRETNAVRHRILERKSDENSVEKYVQPGIGMIRENSTTNTYLKLKKCCL